MAEMKKLKTQPTSDGSTPDTCICKVRGKPVTRECRHFKADACQRFLK